MPDGALRFWRKSAPTMAKVPSEAERRMAQNWMISSPRDVSDSCHHLRDELKTHEPSLRALLSSAADDRISRDLAITPHAGDRARYDVRCQLKMASCRVFHRVEGAPKVIPCIAFIARRRNRRVLLTMARGSDGHIRLKRPPRAARWPCAVRRHSRWFRRFVTIQGVLDT